MSGQVRRAGLEQRDGSYAWLRLCVNLALSAIGGVGLWSIVVVLPAVQAEFGVARGAASLPYTAAMLGFVGGSVLMGRLADRFGVMVPVLLGTAVLSLSYLMLSLAESLLAFTLWCGVVGLLGSAAVFSPLVADAALWFARRRGIAVAIAASGNYLAGTAWPPVLSHLLETVGWRQAHAIIGLFCLATMLPLALFLRRRPPLDPPATAASTRAATLALRGISPAALQGLLMLSGLACCVAMAMPQVHIVAYCTDLGFGPARGAEMLSLMLAAGVVSRLGFGLLMDRIGGPATLLLGSLLQATALALFLPFDGLVPLYVVSALFGLFQGGIVPSYAVIIRNCFPAEQAGFRVGMILGATLAGMALGGWLTGVIFDATGSYHAAIWHGLAWNAVNAGIVAWLFLRLRRPVVA